MGIVDRIQDRWPGQPLQRSDAPKWGAATSLQDLCDLTAQWLEGDIGSQPGYYGAVDVDEDDAPGLTDTLIISNRCGFLTRSSQAGMVTPGYDNAGWVLHAAVDGHADKHTVEWLEWALSGTRFVVEAHPVKAYGFLRGFGGEPVTFRAGQACTWFGGQRSAGSVKSELDGCSEQAVSGVCDALIVAVYDPQPGSNDLWPTLLAAAEAQ